MTSEYFRGGKITTIFGSNEINLVNAQLADGQNELDLFTLFGSTELTVPRDWDVKVDVTPILGSFEDRRRQVLLPGNPAQQLTIRGLVLFGSGELMNV
ncbi:MAG: LiaF domain-containing protein [Tunicatimonas sp.]